MTPLREFQLQFAAAMQDEADTRFATHILANGLSGTRRLRVYRNNIQTNLGDALRALYPVIEKLVGAEFFAHIARHYIVAHPSRSGNLHAFGAHFAEFLRTFAGLEGLGYLGDVAQLEWYYHEVFHEAPHAPLALDRLAQVDPEKYGEMRFTVHPALRLMASPYPILRIWSMNQPGYSGTDTLDLPGNPDRILVIRRDLDIDFESLSTGAFALLAAFAQGATFAAARDAAHDVESGFEIAGAFQHFILSNALVDFTLQLT